MNFEWVFMCNNYQPTWSRWEKEVGDYAVGQHPSTEKKGCRRSRCQPLLTTYLVQKKEGGLRCHLRPKPL